MEQTKKQIEDSFNIIEHRVANSGKLSITDRKKELELIEIAVAQLESELDRFQLLAFTKYSNEIDEYEERLNSLKFKLRKMNEEEITASQVVEEVKEDAIVEQVFEDATQKQIDETNAKLKEGKERVLGMLKTVNNMKEELNLIDDEIMLQREKMVAIKEKMKQTQNVVFQTKKIVNKMAKSLSEDLFMKVMIWIIFVSLLIVIGLIIGIKFTKNSIKNNRHDKELEKFSQMQFQEIDEDMFIGLEKNPLEELNKLSEVDQNRFSGQTAAKPTKKQGQMKSDEGIDVNTNSESGASSSENSADLNKDSKVSEPGASSSENSADLNKDSKVSEPGASSSENSADLNKDSKVSEPASTEEKPESSALVIDSDSKMPDNKNPETLITENDDSLTTSKTSNDEKQPNESGSTSNDKNESVQNVQIQTKTTSKIRSNRNLKKETRLLSVGNAPIDKLRFKLTGLKTGQQQSVPQEESENWDADYLIKDMTIQANQNAKGKTIENQPFRRQRILQSKKIYTRF